MSGDWKRNYGTNCDTGMGESRRQTVQPRSLRPPRQSSTLLGETQPCQKLDDVAVTIFDIGEDEIDMRIFEDVGGLRVMRGHEDAIVGTVHQSIRSGFVLLTGICNKQDARLDAHLACRLPTDFVVRVRPEFANLRT